VCKVGNKFHVSLGSKYLGSFNTAVQAFYCYKLNKENQIKEVADEGKPLITPQTYQAMYNYKVEIID
jgi:long-subunit fatty acid transport protein